MLKGKLVTKKCNIQNDLLFVGRIVCKQQCKNEGWNFNSGNYLFTTDTK